VPLAEFIGLPGGFLEKVPEKVAMSARTVRRLDERHVVDASAA
jgi:hypothetical protein